jgi:hypothetical protein
MTRNHLLALGAVLVLVLVVGLAALTGAGGDDGGPEAFDPGELCHDVEGLGLADKDEGMRLFLKYQPWDGAMVDEANTVFVPISEGSPRFDQGTRAFRKDTYLEDWC